MRKNIAAGNWKMNLTIEEGNKLASEIVNMVQDEANTETQVILIPPFTHLTSVKNIIGSTKNIFLGAQNCHTAASGAYTGEISLAMLKSVGATHVVIGHSERREYFGETDALLAAKVDAALKNDLEVIFCFGEVLEDRKSGNHFKVVESQIKNALFHLDSNAWSKIILAYEPVWAIGTGETASPDQAQEMHAFIRELVAERYLSDVSEEVSILYGGSVKPGNAEEIFSKTDVDGGLIGGAALNVDDFTAIIKAI